MCSDRNPEWRPLLELVGELSRDFMWMCPIDLETGERLHAYKHRVTRRYLHLTADGDAFADVPAARDDAWRYRPISRHEALLHAFDGWHELSFGDPDYPDLCRQLASAFTHAASGERMTFDPDWLERQRRYEAAVSRATQNESRNDPRYRGSWPGMPGDDFVGDLVDIDATGAAAA